MSGYQLRRRCQIAVFKRDTYRRTGRTKSGFEMHYSKEQCSRAALESRDCCKQHATMIDRGRDLPRADYHEFV